MWLRWYCAVWHDIVARLRKIGGTLGLVSKAVASKSTDNAVTRVSLVPDMQLFARAWSVCIRVGFCAVLHEPPLPVPPLSLFSLFCGVVPSLCNSTKTRDATAASQLMLLLLLLMCVFTAVGLVHVPCTYVTAYVASAVAVPEQLAKNAVARPAQTKCHNCRCSHVNCYVTFRSRRSLPPLGIHIHITFCNAAFSSKCFLFCRSQCHFALTHCVTGRALPTTY